MKKKIDLNDNIIKTIEEELVEGLGLRAVKFQHIGLDEGGVASFVFEYPTSQSITGWKTATYTIGEVEEEQGGGDYMKKYYVVETQGSYVQDVQLSGETINGTYWASYTPISEFEFNSRNTWITDDLNRAKGLALLVGGEVVEVSK